MTQQPLLVQVGRARDTGELGVLLQLPDAWTFMSPNDAQLVAKGLVDAVDQILDMIGANATHGS
jgi:hypothetical protein